MIAQVPGLLVVIPRLRGFPDRAIGKQHLPTVGRDLGSHEITGRKGRRSEITRAHANPGFGQDEQPAARTGAIPVHLGELVAHHRRNVFGEHQRPGPEDRVRQHQPAPQTMHRQPVGLTPVGGLDRGSLRGAQGSPGSLLLRPESVQPPALGHQRPGLASELVERLPIGPGLAGSLDPVLHPPVPVHQGVGNGRVRIRRRGHRAARKRPPLRREGGGRRSEGQPDQSNGPRPVRGPEDQRIHLGPTLRQHARERRGLEGQIGRRRTIGGKAQSHFVPGSQRGRQTPGTGNRRVTGEQELRSRGRRRVEPHARDRSRCRWDKVPVDGYGNAHRTAGGNLARKFLAAGRKEPENQGPGQQSDPQSVHDLVTSPPNRAGRVVVDVARRSRPRSNRKNLVLTTPWGSRPLRIPPASRSQRCIPPLPARGRPARFGWRADPWRNEGRRGWGAIGDRRGNGVVGGRGRAKRPGRPRAAASLSTHNLGMHGGANSRGTAA
jgi:hypothetical protein